jgi:hypothetical protein
MVGRENVFLDEALLMVAVPMGTVTSMARMIKSGM